MSRKAFLLILAGIVGLFSNNVAFAFERDVFVDETLSNYVNAYIPPVNYCNHEDLARVEIVLSPVENIRSSKVSDGDVFDFVVRKDVKYNGDVILLKDTKIKGVIETVTSQGMNGMPAMIFLKDFDLPGISQEKVKSQYLKKGLNLSYIVFPLKWALTFLPPTGSLTNFIVGGPAKISKRNKIKLYYYPNWECL